MADKEKRWFAVTASGEVTLRVLARDSDEAEDLFWKRDDDIDSCLMDPCFLEFKSVNECDPDAEDEQVGS
jgi:hypothetical protein